MIECINSYLVKEEVENLTKERDDARSAQSKDTGADDGRMLER